jgi:RNA polymerase sigma factor (sigma-70 family)
MASTEQLFIELKPEIDSYVERKFYSYKSQDIMQDLKQEAYISALKDIPTWDKERGVTLRGYIVQRVRWHLLGYLHNNLTDISMKRNRNVKRANVVQGDTWLDNLSYQTNHYRNIDILYDVHNIHDRYLSKFSDKRYHALVYHYIKEIPIKKIAKEQGTSTQNIYLKNKKSITYLRKVMGE